MSNDGPLSDSPQTCIRVSISITPGQDAAGDLAGLLGNFAFDLCELVALSRKTSSELNIHLIEEITYVLDHDPPPEGELRVEFSMLDKDFDVDVQASQTRANDVRFTPHGSLTPKEQLAKSVQERRIKAAESGLGLMRLRSGTTQKPSGSSSGMSGAPAVVDFVPRREKS